MSAMVDMDGDVVSPGLKVMKEQFCIYKDLVTIRDIAFLFMHVAEQKLDHPDVSCGQRPFSPGTAQGHEFSRNMIESYLEVRKKPRLEGPGRHDPAWADKCHDAKLKKFKQAPMDTLDCAFDWLKEVCHDKQDAIKNIEELERWHHTPHDHWINPELPWHHRGSLQELAMRIEQHEIVGVDTPGLKTCQALDMIKERIDFFDTELVNSHDWHIVSGPSPTPEVGTCDLPTMRQAARMDLEFARMSMINGNLSPRIPEAMTISMQAADKVVLYGTTWDPVDRTAPHSRTSGARFTCGRDLKASEKLAQERMRIPYNMGNIPANHPWLMRLAHADAMVDVMIMTLKLWMDDIMKTHDWKENMIQRVEDRRSMKKHGQLELGEWCMLLTLDATGRITGLTEPEVVTSSCQILANSYEANLKNMTDPNEIQLCHPEFARNALMATCLSLRAQDRRPGASCAINPWIGTSVLNGIDYACALNGRKVPDIKRIGQKHGQHARSYCANSDCTRNFHEIDMPSSPSGTAHLHFLTCDLDNKDLDQHGFYRPQAFINMKSERIRCTMEDLMSMPTSTSDWFHENRLPGSDYMPYAAMTPQEQTRRMIEDGHSGMICYNCATFYKNLQLACLRADVNNFEQQVQNLKGDLLRSQELFKCSQDLVKQLETKMKTMKKA